MAISFGCCDCDTVAVAVPGIPGPGGGGSGGVSYTFDGGLLADTATNPGTVSVDPGTGIVIDSAGVSVDPVWLAQQLASYATTTSPAFTGDPTAPTPPPGDNDTSIATTAFVGAAIAAALAAIPPDNDTAYAATVGDGTTGPYTVVHNLASEDVSATVRDTATGENILATWRVVDANTIQLEPDVPWPLDSRRVLIQKVV